MRKAILLAMAALAAFVFFNNASFLSFRRVAAPTILAHRGMAQRFDPRDVRNDTCTARRLLPTEHQFLENTIPSMRAAYAAGADIIEVDVHPTTDGQFAVFHDWTLDCRTNGTGVTRDHAMAELKTLDVGYGYTADGGRTFPFRGRGIGLMPTLDDVLSTFPRARILINMKSRDAAEGAKLADVLERLSPQRRTQLTAYGSSEPVGALRKRLPDMRILTKTSIRSCLGQYIALGWTGFAPTPCRNTIILVPINIAPWLWGWPNKFLNRMDATNAQVFVLGPYAGGEFSTGLDTQAQLDLLPKDYSGGIWTNEVGFVARRMAQQHRRGSPPKE